ncbi:hypothetical protein [Candidatus Caldatribacterium saccharofermentans]|uniref:hypothetical protein n=1 Tax=Candidatus Caldatribacterium saccharofermentans TaxID=1454753 RepID=UPI003D07EFA5
MEIPELLAFLDTGGWNCNLWRVWCPFCRRWHVHGAGGKDEDPMKTLGHRVAHCKPGGPFEITGYRLVYGGLWQDLPQEVRRRGAPKPRR